jgi:hypothetical protein
MDLLIFSIAGVGLTLWIAIFSMYNFLGIQFFAVIMLNFFGTNKI